MAPKWDCQEMVRQVAMAAPQEGASRKGVGWNPVGVMREARSLHTATLLRSGKVLVTGGSTPTGRLKSAELYEPDLKEWRGANELLGKPRDNHMATLLLSGKVLVAGGYDDGGELTGAELYDPDKNEWSATGSMVASRSAATMTCLPSGKVLVAGGHGLDDPDATTVRPLKSAEIYDPDLGKWTKTVPMNFARKHHTATLLPSGKVLVTGGQSDNESVVASAEVYDPDLETWTETEKNMTKARHLHTATRLPSGRVLVTGGSGDRNPYLQEAEEYDPSTGTWTETLGEMAPPRDKHTATLLPSGKVLVAGGEGEGPVNVEGTAVYDPGSRTWTAISPNMTETRFWHTATLLLSGKVLFAGGSKGESADRSALVEVYDEGPAAPQVTSPSPNALFLDTWTPHITGTAEPHSTVEVSFDEADTIEVPVDADGAWSYTPREPLGIGPHTLRAEAIDRAGNISEPTSVTFQLIARSHYGWGCSSTSAFPATGICLVALGLLHCIRAAVSFYRS